MFANCDCELTAGCEKCRRPYTFVSSPQFIHVDYVPLQEYRRRQVRVGDMIVPKDSWQRKYAEGELRRWARKMGREDNLGFLIVE